MSQTRKRQTRKRQTRKRLKPINKQIKSRIKNKRKKKRRRTKYVKRVGGSSNDPIPIISTLIDECTQLGIIMNLNDELIAYLKTPNGIEWLTHQTWSSDPYYIEIIHILCEKFGAHDKKMLCVGQSYFLFMSFFMQQSTFMFVDINLSLLIRMKNTINELNELIKSTGYVSYTKFCEIIQINQTGNSESIDATIQNIKQLLGVDDENELMDIFNQQFVTNEYIFMAASFPDVDETYFDVDYVNVSNLISHRFGDKIPGFWDKMQYIQSTYPKLLFIGTNAPPNRGFVFEYNDEIKQSTDNSILDISPGRLDDTLANVHVITQKEWIKYYIYNFNWFFIVPDNNGLYKGEEREAGKRALKDILVPTTHTIHY